MSIINRLKAWCETTSCFGLDSIGKDCADAIIEIESLKQQLAECQATNGKLVAAYYDLPKKIAEFCFGSKDEAGNCSMAAAFLSVAHCLSAKDGLPPLMIPNDATALNELIAERTKELAEDNELLRNLSFRDERDQLRHQNAELTAQRDALLALEVDSANKNCNKKTNKLARLNDKLKAEMLSLDTE